MSADRVHLDRLPTERRRILLVPNRKAGARSGKPILDQLIAALSTRGMDVQVVDSLDAIAGEVALEQSRGSLRAVIAAGGDGTVAELVNRLPEGIPLAIMPLGTENLLACYLGITADPEQLAAALADGVVTRCDAALANGRICMLMAGCGFDAHVVHRLALNRTGHISRWSYARPILHALMNYRYPRIRVHYLEVPQQGSSAEPQQNVAGGPTTSDHVSSSQQTGTWKTLEARWAFVFNLPCYGGGLSLMPQANGADGLLDICTFQHGSLYHFLRYVAKIYLGSHQRSSDCTVVRASQLRIDADEPIHYQLDGDPGGLLPLEMRVLPGRLRIVVPVSTVSAAIQTSTASPTSASGEILTRADR